MNDNLNHLPALHIAHRQGTECIGTAGTTISTWVTPSDIRWRQGLKAERGETPADKQIEDCEKRRGILKERFHG
jgi:hypothetical protein